MRNLRQSVAVGAFTNQKGYGILRLKNGKCIPVSKYVWQEMYGRVPDGYEIDHIDNDITNNDLSNLRLLTKRMNVTRRYNKMKEMSSEEIKNYLDAISEEVFHKPFINLNYKEKNVLRLNIFMRKGNEIEDEDIFVQLINYIMIQPKTKNGKKQSDANGRQ